MPRKKFFYPLTARLPVARDSRTSPEVRSSDSDGLARDAGVVEAPPAHTNRILDCGDRRGGLVTHSGTPRSRISALFAGRIVQPV